MHFTISIPFYDDSMWADTQCGKTRLLIDLIKHNEKLIEPPPDKLLYLFTAEQTGYDTIKRTICDNAATSTLKTYEFIDCNNGLPSMSVIKPKLGKATLLILDDLMVIAAPSTKNVDNLNNLASCDSHHTNTSVIFVCQNLNYSSGKLCNTRVNSQYHILFKSLTDSRDVEMIASNKKISIGTLQKVLQDVGKKQYGYLVFDGSPKGCCNTRLRTGILPDNETIIYDIDKETV